MTVTYSDGSNIKWPLTQTDQGQHLKIAPKKITWLVLENLIKSDAPSPFPALTQLEVHGKEWYED